jgi:hypothetical protein
MTQLCQKWHACVNLDPEGIQHDLAHHHGMWHRTAIADLLIAETGCRFDASSLDAASAPALGSSPTSQSITWTDSPVSRIALFTDRAAIASDLFSR